MTLLYQLGMNQFENSAVPDQRPFVLSYLFNRTSVVYEVNGTKVGLR